MRRIGEPLRWLLKRDQRAVAYVAGETPSGRPCGGTVAWSDEEIEPADFYKPDLGFDLDWLLDEERVSGAGDGTRDVIVATGVYRFRVKPGQSVGMAREARERRFDHAAPVGLTARRGFACRRLW